MAKKTKTAAPKRGKPAPTKPTPRYANPFTERWENAERVLNAMPEHERLKHFDMGSWGYKNHCGTIACAAGQCGLDPWFRRRGFKLTFPKNSTRGVISEVPAFFGFEGAQRIFYNTTARSVETVLGEVREYVGELRKIETLTAALTLPKIGEEWPEQGGIYAGIRIGKGGADDYLLIVGPEHDGYLTWNSAIEWAGTLAVVGAHRDFALPTRLEGAALFDRMRSSFQPYRYWLSEQPASNSTYAWAQSFDNGCQFGYHKVSDFRARSVRRLPIQSLGNSVISGAKAAA